MSELIGSQAVDSVELGDTCPAGKLAEESKTVIRQALGAMAVSGGFSLKDQAKDLIESFRLVDEA
ncbi:hypothetical protein K5M36_16900 [Chromobacterium vaccinii]|nr:hypothetical protein [Chromobacterium vaccinii]